MSYKCYEVTDSFNSNKVHVFRAYSDGHIAYNQRICGSLFYSSFVRINRHHGYYNYYYAAAKEGRAHGVRRYFVGEPHN